MSLIDEALKRARLEAAQRAAQSEGMPYPAIPRHLAPPRRRRWLAPAAVAATVIAGLAVGMLLVTRGGSQPHEVAAVGGADTAQPVTGGPATPGDVVRDPSPAQPDPAAPDGAPAGAPATGDPPAGNPAAASPAIPPQTPAAQPVTSGPASPAELVRDPPAPPAPAAAPQRPEPQRPAPSRPESSRTEPSRPEPSRAESSPPQPSRTAPSAPAAAQHPEPPPAATTVTDPDSGVLLVLPEREAGAPAGAPAGVPVESHVQQVPLPGGGAIELGGIAWSETGPFALINGRVVGPGSTIGDFTLERIQPGHVELAGAGRRIHLSLQ